MKHWDKKKFNFLLLHKIFIMFIKTISIPTTFIGQLENPWTGNVFEIYWHLYICRRIGIWCSGYELIGPLHMTLTEIFLDVSWTIILLPTTLLFRPLKKICSCYYQFLLKPRFSILFVTKKCFTLLNNIYKYYIYIIYNIINKLLNWLKLNFYH